MGLPALGGETLPNAARWHHIFPILWTSGSTQLQRAEGWENILHTRMTKGNTRSPFSPVNCTQMFCTVGVGTTRGPPGCRCCYFPPPSPPSVCYGRPTTLPMVVAAGACRPTISAPAPDLERELLPALFLRLAARGRWVLVFDDVGRCSPSLRTLLSYGVFVSYNLHISRHMLPHTHFSFLTRSTPFLTFN